jgi:hypothetical protein
MRNLSPQLILGVVATSWFAVAFMNLLFLQEKLFNILGRKPNWTIESYFWLWVGVGKLFGRKKWISENKYFDGHKNEACVEKYALFLMLTYFECSIVAILIFLLSH